MFDVSDKVFIKRLSGNFGYLSLVKIFNLSAKYFIIAYLLKTLGTVNYGTYTWLDAIIQFFLLFTNYGFNSYLAKNVIEQQSNGKKAMNTLISNVFQLKFSIFLLGYILLICLTFFYQEFWDYKYLLYLYMFLILGEVFFPLWYFQGTERFKNITISVFIIRLLQLLLVFSFVNEKNDLPTLLWIMVVSNTLYGFLGIYFMKREIPNYSFRFQPFISQYFYLKEGFMFFLGIISVFFFNYLTIYLIGVYFSKDLVTEFDICFKVVFLFVIPFEIFQQALFPIIVKNKNLKQIRQILLFVVIISLCFMLAAYMSSEILLSLFGVENVHLYKNTYNKLIFLIPIIALTYILGSSILIPFGYYKEFNLSLIVTSALYLGYILMLFISKTFTFERLLLGRVIADLVLLVIRMYFIQSKKVLYSE